MLNDPIFKHGEHILYITKELEIKKGIITAVMMLERCIYVDNKHEYEDKIGIDHCYHEKKRADLENLVSAMRVVDKLLKDIKAERKRLYYS